MHTVELLELSIETARQLGYNVRHEWLDGSGGGACEFGGRKWLFIDLALNVVDQLDQVLEAIRNDPAIYLAQVPAPLNQALDIRRAA